MEQAMALQISRELNLGPDQVQAVIRLLDEGNTIPFLARYRKEQTGGLDEEKLRSIASRATYLRNLATRKEEVLRLIDEQGHLTDEIQEALAAADTLQAVEDIYRPFRPKRRTRASVAKERGLGPLAQWLLSRPALPAPDEEAVKYVNPQSGVETPADALSGASDIIAELLADEPEVRHWIRQRTLADGLLVTRAVDPEVPSPYENYYEYSEVVSRIPPHRVLAINRGEREKALRVRVQVPTEPLIEYLTNRMIPPGSAPSPADPYLSQVARDAYHRLLAPAVERDVRSALTETAHAQAIRIFGANLKSLLLTPPIRGRVVMGIDPAYRTGCKIAVVDATGKLLETAVVYPTPPQNEVEQAEQLLLGLVERHGVEIIAIGNGTASRETEAFVAGLIPKAGRPLAYVIVSEAGASVYSASAVARAEFPHLDVSERSAVSIARRLQDPLAELVKIDPKAIGVGQYQHDVDERALESALHDVVESAVNSVGVDLNTASPSLLSYVAGISRVVADNIVKYREREGAFRSRMELLNVPRLGEKTFEQCAGFIRVPESEYPLDNTPIHPESYAVTERLLSALGFTVEDIRRDAPRNQELQQALRQVNISYWAEHLGIGEPTLQDIVEALLRPGRDPRDELPPPVLRTDVLTIDDIVEGMVLTGTVRNVVDFGAFVDIGVQHDGLVHISELSRDYVRHPLDVVTVGDIVQVRVLSIDKDRGRIGLSMIL